MSTLFPRPELLSAQASQMRRDKGVTFSKVPLYGDGKTLSILLVAYFLHFVMVGQATGEFEKYPVSDRPGLEFWLLCDLGQVTSTLWPLIFSVGDMGMMITVMIPLGLLWGSCRWQVWVCCLSSWPEALSRDKSPSHAPPSQPNLFHQHICIFYFTVLINFNIILFYQRFSFPYFPGIFPPLGKYK